jgi:hypothetical protein
MRDVALGVKIFKRANQLRGLLQSIKPTEIEKVYIADDGDITEDKELIYQDNYQFDITVIDLKYDAGLGYGRSEIFKKLDEEYLLIVDTDHRIPENISVLYNQLIERPDMGGISGLLFEAGGITAVCHDLYENEKILFRDTRNEKVVEEAHGYPLVEYDFLPNITMFRRECLEDYCWDPEYVIGKEHIDFYIGHMKQTDWNFGVNPNVLFDHYPDSGDEEYKMNRGNVKKLDRSKEYFLRKWGYKNIFLGQTRWRNPSNTDPHDRIKREILKKSFTKLPLSVQNPILDIRDRRRIKKGKGPI